MEREFLHLGWPREDEGAGIYNGQLAGIDPRRPIGGLVAYADINKNDFYVLLFGSLVPSIKHCIQHMLHLCNLIA